MLLAWSGWRTETPLGTRENQPAPNISPAEAENTSHTDEEAQAWGRGVAPVMLVGSDKGQARRGPSHHCTPGGMACLASTQTHCYHQKVEGRYSRQSNNSPQRCPHPRP